MEPRGTVKESSAPQHLGDHQGGKSLCASCSAEAESSESRGEAPACKACRGSSVHGPLPSCVGGEERGTHTPSSSLPLNSTTHQVPPQMTTASFTLCFSWTKWALKGHPSVLYTVVKIVNTVSCFSEPLAWVALSISTINTLDPHYSWILYFWIHLLTRNIFVTPESILVGFRGHSQTCAERWIICVFLPNWCRPGNTLLVSACKQVSSSWCI